MNEAAGCGPTWSSGFRTHWELRPCPEGLPITFLELHMTHTAHNQCCESHWPGAGTETQRG